LENWTSTCTVNYDGRNIPGEIKERIACRFANGKVCSPSKVSDGCVNLIKIEVERNAKETIPKVGGKSQIIHHHKRKLALARRLVRVVIACWIAIEFVV
jgi:hypothetical protein